MSLPQVKTTLCDEHPIASCFSECIPLQISRVDTKMPMDLHVD
jgi:hypothetical protein